MTKISNAMFEHLLALSKVDERGAYPGLSLGTLKALKNRGYVSASYPVGSMALPHTSIRWRITSAGRSALEATK